ncbi:MAG TPA: precorrin-6y C5,15-methyltransferase (decarboxylating) subunit CbiE [Candidatus Dormibacteraeota bacterium]|nr:precorrin-6y C5,15-methyltransferase (decarboxylating) subunit CbiE [Candidatus Dormibacteraeota bacterium]
MGGEAPWRGRLAVVGIGLEGPAGMSPRGRRLLEAARTVVGHLRHLSLLPEAGGERIPWDGSPAGLEALLAGRDASSIVLLASGDPNLFGIGGSLLRRHGRAAVEVEPAVSSLQLALARAGVPAAGAALLSAHGRPLAAAVGPARHARRAALLTDPEHDPAAVVRALAAAGVEGDARVVVAERLGGPEERVREGTVAKPPPGPYDPLAVVVLERSAAAGPGLGAPESAYAHESGLITKAEVRAVVLAALDVAAEDVVWDLGSGSGSVAVEAGRMAGWGAVYAVERDPERAAVLERNLARHGSWNVEVVRAEAKEAMARLPAPDAVFIGGGGAALGRLVEGAVAALRRRRAGVPGRLVAALATLESTLDAVEACRRLDLGWRLAQVQVSRARAVGSRLGWEALNPVQVLAAEVPRG